MFNGLRPERVISGETLQIGIMGRGTNRPFFTRMRLIRCTRQNVNPIIEFGPYPVQVLLRRNNRNSCDQPLFIDPG